MVILVCLNACNFTVFIGCPEKTITRKQLSYVEICSSSHLPASTCNNLLENKWKIYDEVESCGFQYKIVAAFSHMTRVDDTFIKELVNEVKHVENLFAFAEAFEDQMVGEKLINKSVSFTN